MDVSLLYTDHGHSYLFEGENRYGMEVLSHKHVDFLYVCSSPFPEFVHQVQGAGDQRHDLKGINEDLSMPGQF